MHLHLDVKRCSSGFGPLRRLDRSSKGCSEMTREPVAQSSDTRLAILEEQGRRTRTAQLPDYQIPGIVPI